jgi:hypothetical protein
MEKLIEEKLSQFLNTGTPEQDPFWALFKIKDQMNDAILESVKHGFREGMKCIPTVKDWADDAATIRFLRHREEILLTALNWYADKKTYDNPDSCPIYEIDNDGEEIADEGYTARTALQLWAKVKL